MFITPYHRAVHYYETDQMGVVHHSNYIRYFEEARIDFLNQIGLPMKEIESAGLFTPVLSVSIHYKSPVRFGDEILVIPTLTAFNGVKFEVKYELRDARTNKLCVTGTSGHCIVDQKFRPVHLKRDFPRIYECFHDLVPSGSASMP